MSKSAHFRSSFATFRRAAPEERLRQYDIRVVDRFYAYCLAVARTERHRNDSRVRGHVTTKRTLWVALIAGAVLFHYLLERVALALTLY